MRFEIGLSQRAYATRRGVSPKAMRKAIASCRIASAVLPNGTIDANAADRMWESNTDLSQCRGKEADRATVLTEALVARPVTPPVEETPLTRRPPKIRRPSRRRDSARRSRRTRPGAGRDGEDDAKFTELAEHITANKARARARGNDGPAPGVLS